MHQNQNGRPARVGTALTLLYIGFGIGLLRTIVEASAYTHVVVFITFFLLAVFLFLIYMIGKGRNWARIAYLVLFIIFLPFTVHTVLQDLAAKPISVSLDMVLTVMDMIALVFLFQKPSSAWFKEMKTKKQLAQ